MTYLLIATCSFHTLQVLRDARVNSSFAAAVCAVCRRWQRLCSTNHFYRKVQLRHLTRSTSHITHHTSHITHHTSHITHHTSHITHHTSQVELQPLTGRTLFPAPQLAALQAQLTQPQYSSVCDVAADGVVLTAPLLNLLSHVFSNLTCISFSCCTALDAQPLLLLLRALPCLQALDISSSTSSCRDASPAAPKWMAQVMDAAHVTRHTSHVTCHTSHITRHTSHVTRHTSHVTRHTSHITRHTSHVTRHTCRR